VGRGGGKSKRENFLSGRDDRLPAPRRREEMIIRPAVKGFAFLVSEGVGEKDRLIPAVKTKAPICIGEKNRSSNQNQGRGVSLEK